MAKLKLPKPSKQLIDCAKTVFQAMAYVKTVQPIVESYQREILAKHQFHVSNEFTEKWEVTNHIILDPKETYLMEDSDFQIYLDEVAQEHKKHNFNVPKDHCPLLIAQNLERQAKMALFDQSWELLNGRVDKETFDNIPNHPDSFTNYIDLTLRFLAPLVK